MGKKQRRFTAEFKARVALEAIKERVSLGYMRAKSARGKSKRLVG